MGFVAHKAFPAPPSEDTMIWRYFNLSKFLALIDKSALYFTRIDRLNNDLLEGYYPRKNLEGEKLAYKDLPDEQKKDPLNEKMF